MSETAQAPTETKDKDPSKDALINDFGHVTEVYEAIRAIPNQRREAILTFVIQRLEYDRRREDNAQEKLRAYEAEQYNKMRAQESGQLAGIRGAGVDVLRRENATRY